jgi:hypothetical protein
VEDLGVCKKLCASPAFWIGGCLLARGDFRSAPCRARPSSLALSPVDFLLTRAVE